MSGPDRHVHDWVYVNNLDGYGEVKILWSCTCGAEFVEQIIT